MMEKDFSYKSFEKKIVPYLDGSLTKEELSEFEAFVLTHPDFENQIKIKQDEIQLLKQMIPVAVLSASTQDSIQSEMRASIFNLLKEEPRGPIDVLRIKWEEWTNRN